MSPGGASVAPTGEAARAGQRGTRRARPPLRHRRSGCLSEQGLTDHDRLRRTHCRSRRILDRAARSCTGRHARVHGLDQGRTSRRRGRQEDQGVDCARRRRRHALRRLHRLSRSRRRPHRRHAARKSPRRSPSRSRWAAVPAPTTPRMRCGPSISSGPGRPNLRRGARPKPQSRRSSKMCVRLSAPGGRGAPSPPSGSGAMRLRTSPMLMRSTPHESSFLAKRNSRNPVPPFSDALSEPQPSHVGIGC